MDALLSLAGAGLRAGSQGLDVVANNIANMASPGFKATQPLTMAAGASAQAPAAGSPVKGTLPVNLNFAATQLRGQRSLAEGALRMTGNPLDVAISGSGYLQLRTPSGQTVLSRAGALSLDAAGTLVDAAGAQVLSTSNQVLQLPTGALSLSIGPDGSVSADVQGTSVAVGKMAVVNVPNPQGLVSMGHGWLATSAVSGNAAPASAPLVVGSLEASNVDLARSFAAMVQLSSSMSVDGRLLSYGGNMLQSLNQLV